MGKDYLSRPSWQYNAIMLVRILTDNPGETFTRNIDQKFIDTARQLLKATKAPKARLLLIETLDDFEHTKADDGNLSGLVQMWREEKPKVLQEHGVSIPIPYQPCLIIKLWNNICPDNCFRVVYHRLRNLDRRRQHHSTLTPKTTFLAAIRTRGYQTL